MRIRKIGHHEGNKQDQKIERGGLETISTRKYDIGSHHEGKKDEKSIKNPRQFNPPWIAGMHVAGIDEEG